MKNPKHPTLSSYVTGFVLSIILTIIPYIIVVNGYLSGNKQVVFLLGFAILQLIIQLYFFLHLGQESKPRFNLISLIFMVCIIMFIVVGSLWIMNNLDYHTMTPEQTNNSLLKDEGFR